jgi:hypothetical protein
MLSKSYLMVRSACEARLSARTARCGTFLPGFDGGEPAGTTCCRKATANIIQDLEPRQRLQQIAAAGALRWTENIKFVNI